MKEEPFDIHIEFGHQPYNLKEVSQLVGERKWFGLGLFIDLQVFK